MNEDGPRQPDDDADVEKLKAFRTNVLRELMTSYTQSNEFKDINQLEEFLVKYARLQDYNVHAWIGLKYQPNTLGFFAIDLDKIISGGPAAIAKITLASVTIDGVDYYICLTDAEYIFILEKIETKKGPSFKPHGLTLGSSKVLINLIMATAAAVTAMGIACIGYAEHTMYQFEAESRHIKDRADQVLFDEVDEAIANGVDKEAVHKLRIKGLEQRLHPSICQKPYSFAGGNKSFVENYIEGPKAYKFCQEQELEDLQKIEAEIKALVPEKK